MVSNIRIVEDILRGTYLGDKDIVLLAAVSAEFRGEVLNRSSRLNPVLFSSSAGISGLWHHFQLWEVAMCVQELVDVTFISNMLLLDARAVRTFISALHISRGPIRPFWSARHVYPSVFFAAEFAFPITDLAVEGSFEVESSRIALPPWNVDVFLKYSQEVCHGAVYCCDISLGAADMDTTPFGAIILAISTEYGFQCATDFTRAGGGSVRHEWLSRTGTVRSLRFEHALEHGRPLPFVIAIGVTE